MRIQGTKKSWEYKVQETIRTKEPRIMRIQGTKELLEYNTEPKKNYENTINQEIMRIQGTKKSWEYKEPRNHENTRNQGTISNNYLRNYACIKINKNMQD